MRCKHCHSTIQTQSQFESSKRRALIYPSWFTGQSHGNNTRLRQASWSVHAGVLWRFRALPPLLTRIKLPINQCHATLRMLDLLGINAASIYPDYRNVIHSMKEVEYRCYDWHNPKENGDSWRKLLLLVSKVSFILLSSNGEYLPWPVCMAGHQGCDQADQCKCWRGLTSSGTPKQNGRCDKSVTTANRRHLHQNVHIPERLNLFVYAIVRHIPIVQTRSKP